MFHWRSGVKVAGKNIYFVLVKISLFLVIYWVSTKYVKKLQMVQHVRPFPQTRPIQTWTSLITSHIEIQESVVTSPIIICSNFIVTTRFLPDQVIGFVFHWWSVVNIIETVVKLRNLCFTVRFCWSVLRNYTTYKDAVNGPTVESMSSNSQSSR